MRNTAIFALLALLGCILIASFSSACTPSYTCGEWSSCFEGIEKRTCVDTSCGTDDIVERRLCTSGEGECVTSLQCSPWSQCNYLARTEDVLEGQLKFSGYEERACVDMNGCADNFVEERKCSDSFDVKFRKVERCGITMLVALDANSQREVSRITSDAWRQKKLDISFVQSNFSYCPSCYNGYLDEGEDDIDCGGGCKACVEEKGERDRNLLIASGWILAALLATGVATAFFVDRASRVRVHINRAFKAAEEGDTEKVQKHLSSIRKQYQHLPEKHRKAVDKDLQKIYRRIKD